MILSLNNCKKESAKPSVSYATTADYGANILDTTKINLNAGGYSFASKLSKGATLKIKIIALSPVVGFEGVWYFDPFSSSNWSITNMDYQSKSQTFTAIEANKSCDLNLFFPAGSFLIEYYEMNATVPTRSKTITVN